MDKFIAELRRLYFLPEPPLPNPEAVEAPLALTFAGTGGKVRAMVFGFARAADWDCVARLYLALQEELELPAPAVSVSGNAGYKLWFSLREPLIAERAGVFLNALRRHYLPELRTAHLSIWPDVEASPAPSVLDVPPARHASSGKWSAFIDPGLGSMFSEEPGLGMSPTPDRQADLLAGLKSIEAGDFERALAVLNNQGDAVVSTSELTIVRADESVVPAEFRQTTLKLGGPFADPKSFLLALMNDSSASVDHRIEAARALLPYFIENDKSI